jgi:hypothetical protein
VNPDAGAGVYEINGSRGIKAIHKTAVIGTSSFKKKAFYVEGNPYQMGYLTGLMAESDVSNMCVDFNRDVVFEFIGLGIQDESLKQILGKIVEDISAITILVTGMPADMPYEYTEEINGLYDGCVRANKDTKVTRTALWVLNVGIDSLLSFVYSGKLPDAIPFKENIEKYVKPENFRIPIMCNAYTITGTKVTNSGTFFGRDFMFPTAGVFQYTACYMIRKPSSGIPTVNVCAPGMIGSIAGLSIKGVGVGIDMSPSGNCNPNRPGFNSLLLNRHAIQYGDTCKNAADVIVNAQRGVSWNYVLADGTTDRSCIVEAGCSTANLDFLSYVPQDIKSAGVLPDEVFIANNLSAEVRNGTMIRWNDYKYNDKYLDFNKHLMPYMKEYAKKLVPLALLLQDYKYNYNPDDFLEIGYLNKTRKDTNCPLSYYFAPQRENRSDLLLVTNHYIIPEMRLCAMNEWTQFMSSGNIQDIQWRYDELNKRLINALDNGPVSYETAKRIANFLAPDGDFPDYYNPEGKPMNQVHVHGSISLMDLKNKTIDTIYGYFSDQWVKIRLNNYFK